MSSSPLLGIAICAGIQHGGALVWASPQQNFQQPTLEWTTAAQAASLAATASPAGILQLHKLALGYTSSGHGFVLVLLCEPTCPHGAVRLKLAEMLNVVDLLLGPQLGWALAATTTREALQEPLSLYHGDVLQALAQQADGGLDASTPLPPPGAIQSLLLRRLDALAAASLPTPATTNPVPEPAASAFRQLQQHTHGAYPYISSHHVDLTEPPSVATPFAAAGTPGSRQGPPGPPGPSAVVFSDLSDEDAYDQVYDTELAGIMRAALDMVHPPDSQLWSLILGELHSLASDQSSRAHAPQRRQLCSIDLSSLQPGLTVSAVVLRLGSAVGRTASAGGAASAAGAPRRHCLVSLVLVYILEEEEAAMEVFRGGSGTAASRVREAAFRGLPYTVAVGPHAAPASARAALDSGAAGYEDAFPDGAAPLWQEARRVGAGRERELAAQSGAVGAGVSAAGREVMMVAAGSQPQQQPALGPPAPSSQGRSHSGAVSGNEEDWAATLRPAPSSGNATSGAQGDPPAARQRRPSPLGASTAGVGGVGVSAAGRTSTTGPTATRATATGGGATLSTRASPPAWMLDSRNSSTGSTPGSDGGNDGADGDAAGQRPRMAVGAISSNSSSSSSSSSSFGAGVGGGGAAGRGGGGGDLWLPGLEAARSTAAAVVTGPATGATAATTAAAEARSVYSASPSSATAAAAVAPTPALSIMPTSITGSAGGAAMGRPPPAPRSLLGGPLGGMFGSAYNKPQQQQPRAPIAGATDMYPELALTIHGPKANVPSTVAAPGLASMPMLAPASVPAHTAAGHTQLGVTATTAPQPAAQPQPLSLGPKPNMRTSEPGAAPGPAGPASAPGKAAVRTSMPLLSLTQPLVDPTDPRSVPGLQDLLTPPQLAAATTTAAAASSTTAGASPTATAPGSGGAALLGAAPMGLGLVAARSQSMPRSGGGTQAPLSSVGSFEDEPLSSVGSFKDEPLDALLGLGPGRRASITSCGYAGSGAGSRAGSIAGYARSAAMTASAEGLEVRAPSFATGGGDGGGRGNGGAGGGGTAAAPRSTLRRSSSSSVSDGYSASTSTAVWGLGSVGPPRGQSLQLSGDGSGAARGHTGSGAGSSGGGAAAAVVATGVTVGGGSEGRGRRNSGGAVGAVGGPHSTSVSSSSAPVMQAHVVQQQQGSSGGSQPFAAQPAEAAPRIQGHSVGGIGSRLSGGGTLHSVSGTAAAGLGATPAVTAAPSATATDPPHAGSGMAARETVAATIDATTPVDVLECTPPQVLLPSDSVPAPKAVTPEPQPRPLSPSGEVQMQEQPVALPQGRPRMTRSSQQGTAAVTGAQLATGQRVSTAGGTPAPADGAPAEAAALVTPLQSQRHPQLQQTVEEVPPTGPSAAEAATSSCSAAATDADEEAVGTGVAAAAVPMAAAVAVAMAVSATAVAASAGAHTQPLPMLARGRSTMLSAGGSDVHDSAELTSSTTATTAEAPVAAAGAASVVVAAPVAATNAVATGGATSEAPVVPAAVPLLPQRPGAAPGQASSAGTTATSPAAIAVTAPAAFVAGPVPASTAIGAIVGTDRQRKHGRHHRSRERRSPSPSPSLSPSASASTSSSSFDSNSASQARHRRHRSRRSGGGGERDSSSTRKCRTPARRSSRSQPRHSHRQDCRQGHQDRKDHSSGRRSQYHYHHYYHHHSPSDVEQQKQQPDPKSEPSLPPGWPVRPPPYVPLYPATQQDEPGQHSYGQAGGSTAARADGLPPWYWLLPLPHPLLMSLSSAPHAAAGGMGIAGGAASGPSPYGTYNPYPLPQHPDGSSPPGAATSAPAGAAQTGPSNASGAAGAVCRAAIVDGTDVEPQHSYGTAPRSGGNTGIPWHGSPGRTTSMPPSLATATALPDEPDSEPGAGIRAAQRAALTALSLGSIGGSAGEGGAGASSRRLLPPELRAATPLGAFRMGLRDAANLAADSVSGARNSRPKPVSQQAPAEEAVTAMAEVVGKAQVKVAAQERPQGWKERPDESLSRLPRSPQQQQQAVIGRASAPAAAVPATAPAAAGAAVSLSTGMGVLPMRDFTTVAASAAAAAAAAAAAVVPTQTLVAMLAAARASSGDGMWGRTTQTQPVSPRQPDPVVATGPFTTVGAAAASAYAVPDPRHAPVAAGGNTLGPRAQVEGRAPGGFPAQWPAMPQQQAGVPQHGRPQQQEQPWPYQHLQHHHPIHPHDHRQFSFQQQQQQQQQQQHHQLYLELLQVQQQQRQQQQEQLERQRRHQQQQAEEQWRQQLQEQQLNHQHHLERQQRNQIVQQQQEEQQQRHQQHRHEQPEPMRSPPHQTRRQAQLLQQSRTSPHVVTHRPVHGGVRVASASVHAPTALPRQHQHHARPAHPQPSTPSRRSSPAPRHQRAQQGHPHGHQGRDAGNGSRRSSPSRTLTTHPAHSPVDTQHTAGGRTASSSHARGAYRATPSPGGGIRHARAAVSRSPAGAARHDGRPLGRSPAGSQRSSEGATRRAGQGARRALSVAAAASEGMSSSAHTRQRPGDEDQASVATSPRPQHQTVHHEQPQQQQQFEQQQWLGKRQQRLEQPLVAGPGTVLPLPVSAAGARGPAPALLPASATQPYGTMVPWVRMLSGVVVHARAERMHALIVEGEVAAAVAAAAAAAGQGPHGPSADVVAAAAAAAAVALSSNAAQRGGSATCPGKAASQQQPGMAPAAMALQESRQQQHFHPSLEAYFGELSGSSQSLAATPVSALQSRGPGAGEGGDGAPFSGASQPAALVSVSGVRSKQAVSGRQASDVNKAPAVATAASIHDVGRLQAVGAGPLVRVLSSVAQRLESLAAQQAAQGARHQS